ncbi:MAG: putative bifunctional diguanylate cyclase/phosphodiesterase [Methyloligellaceae bacterium]
MPGQVADEFHKGLIVPLISGQEVARVYILAVDQSSAAAMSKIVLVAASAMTSLLVVLGFSVPAAVAFRRIRERWKVEDQIRFLAMHDPLTGLPNRVYWQKGLEKALARARRRNSVLAVMCIDLDRFKEVNDTLGHNAGDAMLIEASKRLQSCVRETDIVARLGGDEFAVLAEDLDQPAGAAPLAQRICQKLARTFDIEGHEVAISGSVGITLAPAEECDTEDLLRNADLALYRAKNDGRNTFCFFEPEMDNHVRKRRLLASELRHALRNDELHIHYQPQFDLCTGVLTGYEALARWTHKEMGEIPPSRFISIAEENGLIGMLGEWVLLTACRYTSRWPGDSKLTVNISAAQFVAQDLASVVRKTLSVTGLAPERLLLEFTEDVLLRNNDELLKTFQQLTAMGVLLAIDKFGAGNSSISNLTRLPVSKIKIDQSFIPEMENDKNIGAIVNMIVGLGKSLGVTISAGGVETESQAQFLRQIGCHEVQGYLYGRPQMEIHHEPPSAPRASDSSDLLASLTGRDDASGRPGAATENTPVELDTEPVELPCEAEAPPVCKLNGQSPGKPAKSSRRGRPPGKKAKRRKKKAVKAAKAVPA